MKSTSCPAILHSVSPGGVVGVFFLPPSLFLSLFACDLSLSVAVNNGLCGCVKTGAAPWDQIQIIKDLPASATSTRNTPLLIELTYKTGRAAEPHHSIYVNMFVYLSTYSRLKKKTYLAPDLMILC